MAFEPDKIDLHILQILQENGRVTNLQLSHQIGLSPAPTLERVRKLELAGFIKSYHAVLDEDLLGLGIKSFLQVQIDFQKENAIENFIAEVKQIKEVTECHHVTSGCDFILKIYVKDIKAYEKLIKDKISTISVLKSFQSMIILSTSKTDPVLPADY